MLHHVSRNPILNIPNEIGNLTQLRHLDIRTTQIYTQLAIAEVKSQYLRVKPFKSFNYPQIEYLYE